MRFRKQNLSQVVGLSQVSRAPCHSNIDNRTLFGDDKSNHWNARLIFANANNSSVGRSASLLVRCSLTITRDINDELLFVMLFFGFLLFPASFGFGVGFRSAFPSPNAGADDTNVADVGGASLVDVPLPSSLLAPASFEYRPSLGCSWMLAGAPPRGTDVVDTEPW